MRVSAGDHVCSCASVCAYLFEGDVGDASDTGDACDAGDTGTG